MIPKARYGVTKRPVRLTWLLRQRSVMNQEPVTNRWVTVGFRRAQFHLIIMLAANCIREIVWNTVLNTNEISGFPTAMEPNIRFFHFIH